MYLGMGALIQKSRAPCRVGLFLAWPLLRGESTSYTSGPPLPSGMEEMRSGRGCWQLTQVPERVCSDRPSVELGGSQVSPPPCGYHSAELSPTILPHQSSSGRAAAALSSPCSPSFPMGHVSPCD